MIRLANDDTHPDLRSRMLSVVDEITPLLIERARQDLSTRLAKFKCEIVRFEVSPRLLDHISFEGTDDFFIVEKKLGDAIRYFAGVKNKDRLATLFQLNLLEWMAEYGSVLQELVGDKPLFETLEQKTQLAQHRLKMKDERGLLLAKTALSILGRVVGSIFVLGLGIFLPTGEIPSVTEYLFDWETKRDIKYLRSF